MSMTNFIVYIFEQKSWKNNNNPQLWMKQESYRTSWGHTLSFFCLRRKTVQIKFIYFGSTKTFQTCSAAPTSSSSSNLLHKANRVDRVWNMEGFSAWSLFKPCFNVFYCNSLNAIRLYASSVGGGTSTPSHLFSLVFKFSSMNTVGRKTSLKVRYTMISFRCAVRLVVGIFLGNC